MTNFSRQKYRGAFAALLLCVVGIAGCGSDDSGDTTAASLSKAQYIKQADQICAKTEGRQEALIQKFSEQQKKQTPESEAELVSFAGIPPVQQQVEELSELPPPSTGAKEAAAYLKTLEAAVAAGEKDPTILLSGEKSAFTEAEEQAQKFGFKVCGGA